MADEKTMGIETPAVAPAPVISQAIPAIVDSAKPVVPAPTAAPVLSQAPPLSATDPKPVVDKVGSITAPTLTDKK